MNRNFGQTISRSMYITSIFLTLSAGPVQGLEKITNENKGYRFLTDFDDGRLVQYYFVESKIAPDNLTYRVSAEQVRSLNHNVVLPFMSPDVCIRLFDRKPHNYEAIRRVNSSNTTKIR